MSDHENSRYGNDTSRNSNNNSSPSSFQSNITGTVLNTAGTIIRNGTVTALQHLYNSNSLVNGRNANRIANGTDIFLPPVSSSIDDENGDGNLQQPGGGAGLAEHVPTTLSGHDSLGLTAIVGLSLLFFVIVVVGLVGNALVIFVILADRKMRQSVTNLLILNLAAADLVIMALGVPEIVQFMLDRGWLLGLVLCRLNRFLLVVCLYCSVLSLVSVCIERFIAIVFPMKAHIVCTRRKVLYVIAIIWTLSLACGSPTVVFNRLTAFAPVPDTYHCQIILPEPHGRHFLAFKLLESACFYFLPLVVQVALYGMVAKRLYASTEELHTRFQMRPDSSTVALNGGAGGCNRNNNSSSSSSGTTATTDRAADTIRARKGVVKMLVASVVVYTVSYSPHQAHLLYNTFSDTQLPETWHFFVFVMVMTHINSAANPVLYSIFSQNFRRNFKRCLCYVCFVRKRRDYRRTRFDSFDSRGVSRRASTTRTTISRV